MPATAEQLYEAFRDACPVDDDGVPLPAFDKLAGGARGWFAIVNEIENIAAPPGDTVAPTVVPVEVPERVASTGVVIVESPRERPSTLTLRAHRADDLCVRQAIGQPEFDEAVLARLLGIELRTVLERMDPADVNAATLLCFRAAGSDGADACMSAYHAADAEGPRLTSNHPAMIEAWRAVAQALMVEVDGNVARVRCRTPDAGTITIGPLRAGHFVTMRSVSAERGEWAGRIAAMAKASGASETTLRGLRLEDVVNCWTAFETLKKKVDERTISILDARLSSQSSAASPPSSSTG